MSQLCVEIRKKEVCGECKKMTMHISFDMRRTAAVNAQKTKSKKEPLYFIVDEFNVYHKMLNEFAVVVCSHFG